MTTERPTPATDPAGRRSSRGKERSAGSLATNALPATDEQWRVRLTPEEFRVLRQAGTERAFTGEYVDTKTKGTYQCRACGVELFSSDTKFDSHCGWPSFSDALPGAVRFIEDNSFGMRRIEVRCARCDSHLGHRFDGEGYPTATDQRYCINSISMTLDPAE